MKLLKTILLFIILITCYHDLDAQRRRSRSRFRFYNRSYRHTSTGFNRHSYASTRSISEHHYYARYHKNSDYSNTHSSYSSKYGGNSNSRRSTSNNNTNTRYAYHPSNTKKSYYARKGKFVSRYRSTNGVKIKSPTIFTMHPRRATALCKDGTYSFSQSRQQACFQHGGVAQWLGVTIF